MDDQSRKILLDHFFCGDEAVRPGHVFGCPAYFVGRTMFACLYEGRLGLRVPEDVANEARGRDGISDFRPRGKTKMREWIQLEFQSQEQLRAHDALMANALHYAKSRAAQ